MAHIEPGTCRHCGCNELQACRLSNGDTCVWLDRTRLVCSNPGCIRAEQARLDAARVSRSAPRFPAHWGFGAICEEMRKQQRRERRRKGRAA